MWQADKLATGHQSAAADVPGRAFEEYLAPARYLDERTVFARLVQAAEGRPDAHVDRVAVGIVDRGLEVRVADVRYLGRHELLQLGTSEDGPVGVVGGRGARRPGRWRVDGRQQG